MNAKFIGKFVIEGGRRCRMVHYWKQPYFQQCNSVEAEGVYCTKTMQELRRMQMLEKNLSLGLEVWEEGPFAFMPKECLILATESNAIVLYNNLQNLFSPSQAIIGDFENIASQENLITQLCLEFDSSAEHITAIDVMNARVKFSEGSDLGNDPKMVPEEVDDPTVEEAKHSEYENAAFSIDTGLEVEETKAYKLKSCLIEVIGFYFFNYTCFKILIYICLCKLNGLVNVITKNVGGNTSSNLNFTLEGAYCCLSYVSDVMPLMAAPGEFSNHLMNWFRIWYNLQIKDLKFFVVSPYLLQTLQALVKDKHGKKGQSFALFLEKKSKRYLPGPDNLTLIIPYLFGKH